MLCLPEQFILKKKTKFNFSQNAQSTTQLTFQLETQVTIEVALVLYCETLL